MASESASRSDLIDVTFEDLHASLSAPHNGMNLEQLKKRASQRLPYFTDLANPFGTPSPASKSKIESGSITLSDGVKFAIEDEHKAIVLGISAEFGIDEINAFILFRSFLCIQPLDERPESEPLSSWVKGIVDDITTFYFAERLALLRVLIPLIHALEDEDRLLHDFATEFIPKLTPSPQKFAESVVNRYIQLTQKKVLQRFMGDPKLASRWAKQSCKEQLVLVELIFWLMWDYVECTGPLVVQIFEAAYNSNMGSIQENSSLLYDEEGAQVQQDIAVMWILVTVEVLELESLAEKDITSHKSEGTELYIFSPQSLMRIHNLVISNSSGHFACTFLAWTYVLFCIINQIEVSRHVPDAYRPLVELIVPQLSRNYTGEREPLHIVMSRAAVTPNAGLFPLLLTILTGSPLLVSSIGWRIGSTVTDMNPVEYRCILKGLLIALLSIVPVEEISDFESLVEVWIALFGRGESESVAGICEQFWKSDWEHGPSRRAIFDVARARFPIEFRLLIRLLRAMAGNGSLDTDPLAPAHQNIHNATISKQKESCERYVYYFFEKLPTYTQLIPSHGNPMYQSSTSAGQAAYSISRSIILPGNVVLRADTRGKGLSGDQDGFVIVCWGVEHSGWRLAQEVLAEYVRWRRIDSSGNTLRSGNGVNLGGAERLSIADIGLGRDSQIDDELVIDILDLFRTILGNAVYATALMHSLEPNSTSDPDAPDLVELAMLILENALTGSNPSTGPLPRTRLLTSSMGILASIIAIPQYANRVWLYLRSSPTLFGTARAPAQIAPVLSAEQAAGSYTLTIGLLKLARSLLDEALQISPVADAHLQRVKDDVLLRAFKLMHTHIWLDHLNWKYSQLGDRFEISRRICSLYMQVLLHTPHPIERAPLPSLSQGLVDTLLLKASTSAIQPVVTSITTAPYLLKALQQRRRLSDRNRVIWMLEELLPLATWILNRRLLTSHSSMLEKALCVAGTVDDDDIVQPHMGPIDALARFAQDRRCGDQVPLDAINLLYMVSLCMSSTPVSSTTLTVLLSSPVQFCKSLISRISNPYDDPLLRHSIWMFMSLAVDKEPALSSLFVSGRFHGHANGLRPGASEQLKESTLDVASDTLASWQDLWNLRPQILAAVLAFIDAVWQRGAEHMASIKGLRTSPAFWERIIGIATIELGPLPDCESVLFVSSDGRRLSNHHEMVSSHAYRTSAKSFAVHILALELDLDDGKNSKSLCFSLLEPKFKAEEEIQDLLSEAAPNSYQPEIFDQVAKLLAEEFSPASLTDFENPSYSTQRQYGDEYTFSLTSLRSRIHKSNSDEQMVDLLERLFVQINLNLSLSHTQTGLTESWTLLLQNIVPYTRQNSSIQSNVLVTAASISFDIAKEEREGEMAASIHNIRISFLLSMLEVAWFAPFHTPKELKFIGELSENVRALLLNGYQPIAYSFQRSPNSSFHRPALKVIYFIVSVSRGLLSKPKVASADLHLKVNRLVEVALNLIIDALRTMFLTAKTTSSLELDCDMELLVAVFEQCTLPDINPSVSFWLALCQETDVIKASLDLFTRIDLAGLSDISQLVSQGRPLYTPHLLNFHTCLARLASSAERLAADGLLSAYTANSLTAVISAGEVDVHLPQLSGERSTIHIVYCSALSTLCGVIPAMGKHGYFLEELCGFIQLYAAQIHRALSWTVATTISTPMLEEMELIARLFYSVAESVSPTLKPNNVVADLLHQFSIIALRLLQQLTYALTHPHQLASGFEPSTHEERSEMESLSDANVTEHPQIVRLIHSLYRLSNSLLMAVISIGGTERVMLQDKDSWPIHQAVLVPHSKVVLGEPASIGTLLELGNVSLDTLRSLLSQGSPKPVVTGSPKTQLPSLRDRIAVVRQTLEAVSMYTVAQLALWLLKPEFDAISAEMEGDEEISSENISLRPVGHRASISINERFRRGMTGEIGTDLQALFGRAKPLISQSNSILGPKSIDVTTVLSKFLQERVLFIPES